MIIHSDASLHLFLLPQIFGTHHNIDSTVTSPTTSRTACVTLSRTAVAYGFSEDALPLVSQADGAQVLVVVDGGGGGVGSAAAAGGDDDSW